MVILPASLVWLDDVVVSSQPGSPLGIERRDFGSLHPGEVAVVGAQSARIFGVDLAHTGQGRPGICPASGSGCYCGPMPWFAWIAIVAIVVFGITQIISMATGRPLPSGAKSDEVEELRRRIAELEADGDAAPKELDDRIPTKSEVNLAAEDRWRLEMLEARLEELEKRRREGPEDGPQDSTPS